MNPYPLMYYYYQLFLLGLKKVLFCDWPAAWPPYHNTEFIFRRNMTIIFIMSFPTITEMMDVFPFGTRAICVYVALNAIVIIGEYTIWGTNIKKIKENIVDMSCVEESYSLAQKYKKTVLQTIIKTKSHRDINRISFYLAISAVTTFVGSIEKLFSDGQSVVLQTIVKMVYQIFG